MHVKGWLLHFCLAFLLGTSCLLVHGARASKTLKASSDTTQSIMKESWEGTLEVIAVDYFHADPPRAETWYSLRLQNEAAPVTRLSLDVSAVKDEMAGLSTGMRIRVTGEIQEAGKVKVQDLVVLDRE